MDGLPSGGVYSKEISFAGSAIPPVATTSAAGGSFDALLDLLVRSAGGGVATDSPKEMDGGGGSAGVELATRPVAPFTQVCTGSRYTSAIDRHGAQAGDGHSAADAPARAVMTTAARPDRTGKAPTFGLMTGPSWLE